ncbi:tetratricopeptide repeat protein [Streptacidiphilus sp. EB103A]|uniref:tetratricopeptide repeat protein n=1 Tax=Streptacidiphilus sp. EB103A TaxID=3156275 RepID=UPI003513DF95
MEDAAHAFYEELRALEIRAKHGRRAAGKLYSRRLTQTVLRKDPYRVSVGAQRISTWVPEDPRAAQVPSPASSDNLMALVQLWSHWSGEHPDERRWRNLLDQAQPVRPSRNSTAGPGQLIAEVNDPFSLEVHRAVEFASLRGGEEWGVLPAYVPRAHDARIGKAIGEAAAGVSRLVLLVGESSTGKTRACWEAVHSLPQGWRLWHPLDPDAALEAIGQIRPRTVMWLDESQRYLLTSDPRLGERLAVALRTLLCDSKRAPVMVLGSVWPRYCDVLTRDPRDGEVDSHAQARALLSALGTVVEIPSSFTRQDLDALSVAAEHDPRLAYAADRAEPNYMHEKQITQFLAGAPALLQRYHTAPGLAKALIEVAMDARRLGHGTSISQALLESAVQGYLTAPEQDSFTRASLERALAHNAEPLHGIRGPLTPVRDPQDNSASDKPHYRLADYLDQHARSARSATIVPAPLWDALLDHAPRTDLRALGDSARRRGLLQLAVRFHKAAAAAGDTLALESVAQLLEEAGRVWEALPWYECAASAGSNSALERAASMMLEIDQYGLAFPLLRRAVKVGNTSAMITLAMKTETHDKEAALLLYLRAIEAGNPNAINALWPAAFLLAESGRVDEAIVLYERFALTRNHRYLSVVAVMLEDSGHTEAAIDWHQRSAAARQAETETVSADAVREHPEAGNPWPLLTRARTLVKTGRADEALKWCQRAGEAGECGALQLMTETLAAQGRTEEGNRLRQYGWEPSGDVAEPWKSDPPPTD